MRIKVVHEPRTLEVIQGDINRMRRSIVGLEWIIDDLQSKGIESDTFYNALLKLNLDDFDRLHSELHHRLGSDQDATPEMML